MIRKLIKAGRHFGPTWRYVFNFKPSVSHMFSPTKLNEREATVVRTMNRDGIAISSIDEVFGGESLFGELEDAVGAAQESMASELAELKSKANEPGQTGSKTYMKFYLGEKPLLDPEGIYARFALQQSFINIANAYFSMRTSLRYYNVWHNFAYKGPARESQLWHRDREDHLLLKIFVYLCDVDEEGGPFTYAPGTHPKGAEQRKPEFHLENGVERSNDDQMAAIVPEKNWITATGKRATIAFADTRGYHRGGLARESDRLLYTCMFTSPGCQRVYFEKNSGYTPPSDAEKARILS